MTSDQEMTQPLPPLTLAGVKFQWNSEWVKCHWRFDESTLGKVSSVPLMLRDLSDLGPMIRFRVFPKKWTLQGAFFFSKL